MITVGSLGLGLAFSVLGGALLQHALVEWWAWGRVNKDDKLGKRPRGVLTVSLGMLERGLYTLSIAAGEPAWIGVWIGMKTARSWNRWQDKSPESGNVWLFGNGLAVLWGVVGGWIAQGCPNHL